MGLAWCGDGGRGSMVGRGVSDTRGCHDGCCGASLPYARGCGHAGPASVAFLGPARLSEGNLKF